MALSAQKGFKLDENNVLVNVKIKGGYNTESYSHILTNGLTPPKPTTIVVYTTMSCYSKSRKY